MKNKPTYEELERKVQELEQQVLEGEGKYESLLEQTETLQTLLNALTDSVLLVDSEYRILTINETGAQRLGKSVSEMIGTNFADHFPPEVASYRKAWGEQVKQTGKPARFQDHRAGRFYESTANPVLDSEGKVRAIAVSARDVTANVQVFQTMLESEENFRSLAENAKDGIMIAAGEGFLVYANRTASEITGYTIDEMIGAGINDLASPDEADAIMDTYRRRIRGEDVPHTYETRIARKDGTTVPIELTGARTTWRGSPASLVMVRDITARTQMERDLRWSEERFRAIFEGSLDAIFLVDPETGIILDASPVASELLLRELDEIVGSHYLQLYPSHSAEEMKRGFDSLFREEGQTKAFQAAMRRSDGTEVPIEALGQVIQIDGVPVIHGIVRDITDRKRMEEELLKTQKLESLGILAGRIAHDFNNILTAISTNISMARMYGDLEDDIAQMIADAEKASFRARNLTQQLLAFSKGGAPVRKAVSILRILKENMEFALSGANVRCEGLSHLMKKDLWQVEADEGQIGQVVHNLVINAIQAMPEGGVIKIGAENVPPDEPKHIPLKRAKHVRISITDHGVGIRKRYLQRIFDPFFTTKQKGSGLGLTTSFKIVRNHGGHIHVDSEVGVGTTVTLYMPAFDQGPVLRERTTGGPPRGRGRVLLIDDEEMIRKAASEALRRLGYDVTLAEDGSEGTRLYEEALQGAQTFDAVLLDLTLPGGIGGEEAVRNLLRIDPGARVIASSGYSNDPVMANFAKHGFKDVIIKPYRIDELGEVLQKLVKEDR